MSELCIRLTLNEQGEITRLNYYRYAERRRGNLRFQRAVAMPITAWSDQQLETIECAFASIRHTDRAAWPEARHIVKAIRREITLRIKRLAAKVERDRRLGITGLEPMINR